MSESLIQRIFIDSQNEERSQAVARLIFIAIMYLYFTLQVSILKTASLHDAEWMFLIGVVGYALFHLIWVIRDPKPHQLRRVMAIVFDMWAVTTGMFLLEWAGLFIYPLYLWIIVGNGMRFGSRYLFTAMALALAGFGFLLIFQPFWNENFQMGLGLLGVIAVLPLFFLVMLKRLQRSNKGLREQLELRKRQQAIMIEQSRNAAMGEMISNIAHQWRQPLNTIALLFQNIQIMHEMGKLNHEELDRLVSKGMNITQMMSGTIDDFRNFFKPNKDKEQFDITMAVDRAMGIIADSLRFHDIRVEQNLQPALPGYGYANEFAQVLLNLLSNAKDALEEHRSEGKVIRLSSYDREDRAVIVVEDNGGGIPETAMGRIFEPYFSTKQEGEGTGIGLYMSRLIIEEHMKGTIDVRNSQTGACFMISIPMKGGSDDYEQSL